MAFLAHLNFIRQEDEEFNSRIREAAEEEFNISIREAAEEVAWLHSIIDIPGASSGTTPPRDKICGLAPETLVEEDGKISSNNRKYYIPSGIYIGPYYHGKFRGPMEKWKLKAVRELLRRTFYKSRSGEMESIEKVYKSVEQDLLSARDCYASHWFDGKPFISDSEWCRIMFCDGCFIIYFITSESNSWFNIMKKHDRDLVWRDLLLIQNQLPFRVLSVLQQALRYEQFTVPRAYTSLHRMLLTKFCPSAAPTLDDYMNKVTRQQGEPLHLLQCYRDLLMYILFGNHIEEDRNEEEQAQEEDRLAVWPHYSVTELKKAGIRCSWASNSMNYPKGIHLKLSMLSGKLFLPQLIIDEWTVTSLFSLVSYEYSHKLQNRSVGITSFLSFMSMLINGEEDVKELRDRGVLQLDLKVGDDQVVNFFRDITAHRELNHQDFKDVKQQIFTCINSKRQPLRIAYAELKQRYFSGPWSFLVFLAVIFTVTMTVIQTVLTGIQTYK